MSRTRRLRTWILPSGQHRRRPRAGRPPLLNEQALGTLVQDGVVEPLIDAPCPAEGRTRPHAQHVDGSRTCFECKSTTAGDQ